MSRVGLACVLLGLVSLGRAEMPPGIDVPLARVRVLLRDGATHRVVVHGRWDASTATIFAPDRDGALLRMLGAPGEADTGPIMLAAGRWRRAGTTFRYVDPHGRASGIRRVTLR